MFKNCCLLFLAHCSITTLLVFTACWKANPIYWRFVIFVVSIHWSTIKAASEWRCSINSLLYSWVTDWKNCEFVVGSLNFPGLATYGNFHLPMVHYFCCTVFTCQQLQLLWKGLLSVLILNQIRSTRINQLVTCVIEYLQYSTSSTIIVDSIMRTIAK